MKAKKITAIIVTALTCLLVLYSGILKLVHYPAAVKVLDDYNVGEYITILGCMEVVFTLLFIYPKTMKLGFLLLACYFAGAMGTDLSHGHGIGNPLLPMALVWISAFLRDSSLFLPAKRTSENK